MKNYAWVVDGKVKNVIVFDDKVTIIPKEGEYIECGPTIEKDDSWDGEQYIKSIKDEPAKEKTSFERSKEIIKAINMVELDKTDLGKAVKAILVLQGLI